MTRRDIVELERLVDQLWNEMDCTGECPKCEFAIKTQYDYYCPIDNFSNVIYAIFKNPTEWNLRKG